MHHPLSNPSQPRLFSPFGPELARIRDLRQVIADARAASPDFNRDVDDVESVDLPQVLPVAWPGVASVVTRPGHRFWVEVTFENAALGTIGFESISGAYYAAHAYYDDDDRAAQVPDDDRDLNYEFYDAACSDTDWCACEFCYDSNYAVDHHDAF